MKPVSSTIWPNPCIDCGNSSVELFPMGEKWYVGCKPCVRAGHHENTVTATTRDEALAIWNVHNPSEWSEGLESSFACVFASEEEL